jgi:hypothetical protein
MANFKVPLVSQTGGGAARVTAANPYMTMILSKWFIFYYANGFHPFPFCLVLPRFGLAIMMHKYHVSIFWTLTVTNQPFTKNTIKEYSKTSIRIRGHRLASRVPETNNIYETPRQMKSASEHLI